MIEAKLPRSPAQQKSKSSYGFAQKDHSGTEELEDRHFRNSKGFIVGKINVPTRLSPGSRDKAVKPCRTREKSIST